jgi:hypothetical protein
MFSLRALVFSVCVLDGANAQAIKPLAAEKSELEPATVLFAIDQVGHLNLSQIKASINAAGPENVWVELGDQLLVRAKPSVIRSLEGTLSLQTQLGNASLSEFALQARGCAAAPEFALPPIAKAGRFALVRLPKAFAPMRYSSELQPLLPNVAVARGSNNLPSTPLTKGTDPLARFLADRIKAERWFTDVVALAGFDRSTFSPTLSQARSWIGTRFQSMGLTVSFPSYNFTFQSQSYQNNNVLGFYQGVGTPNEWLVIGGHYDSRTINILTTAMTPGAEDNASGCAGVIELARALTKVKPNRSILFFCYSGEEQNLLGSRAHVTQLQQSGDISKLKFFLTMDMIGYSGDNDFDVLLESNSSNQAVLNQFAAAAAGYEPRLRVLQALNPFGSDHVPYLQAGIPGLLTIENDWDSYPEYHESSDTPSAMTNALTMGGAILRMNAAALSNYLGGVTANYGDFVFDDTFE